MSPYIGGQIVVIREMPPYIVGVPLHLWLKENRQWLVKKKYVPLHSGQ